MHQLCYVTSVTANHNANPALLQSGQSPVLLARINPNNTTLGELRAALCRDIDALGSQESLLPSPPVQATPAPSDQPPSPPDLPDERPSPDCVPVPRSHCALAYDSSTCRGGWKLLVTEGQRTFPFFSFQFFKYRSGSSS